MVRSPDRRNLSRAALKSSTPASPASLKYLSLPMPQQDVRLAAHVTDLLGTARAPPPRAARPVPSGSLSRVGSTRSSGTLNDERVVVEGVGELGACRRAGARCRRPPRTPAASRGCPPATSTRRRAPRAGGPAGPGRSWDHGAAAIASSRRRALDRCPRFCQNRQTACASPIAVAASPAAVDRSRTARRLSCSQLELVESSRCSSPASSGAIRCANARNHAAWRADWASVSPRSPPAARPRRRESCRGSGNAGRRAVSMLRIRLWSASATSPSTTRSQLVGWPADGLRGGEVDAALEDGQAVEEQPVALVEQVVAPRDRAAQRLLALGQVTRAAERAGELVLEPGANGVGREELDPGGRQLDGQRHPVEPRRDGGDGRRVLVRDAEVRPDRGRPGR